MIRVLTVEKKAEEARQYDALWEGSIASFEDGGWGHKPRNESSMCN
jgi:hypothetical protein